MNKHIAPHITAVLTGAGAVLSVVHPGFSLPVGVQGLVASLCVLTSTFTEALHFVRKHNLESNIALATHLANSVSTTVAEEKVKA